MTLWLLTPHQTQDKNDDPWTPWYDKAFGFVVRADSEAAARQYAHEQAGDENCERGALEYTQSPWLDARYTACELLTEAGSPGVILRDYQSA